MPINQVILVPGAGPKKPKPASTAPVFPIIFTIVADGRLPGTSNLLHIRAKFSPELQWQRNILPQLRRGKDGGARTGRYITQELVDLCVPEAIPLQRAMGELREWLSRFNGKIIVAGSAVTFWHLCHAMQQVLPPGAGMPWKMQCLDLASYAAGMRGRPASVKALLEKSPEAAINERERVLNAARGMMELRVKNV